MDIKKKMERKIGENGGRGRRFCGATLLQARWNRWFPLFPCQKWGCKIHLTFIFLQMMMLMCLHPLRFRSSGLNFAGEIPKIMLRICMDQFAPIPYHSRSAEKHQIDVSRCENQFIFHLFSFCLFIFCETVEKNLLETKKNECLISHDVLRWK